MFCSRLTESKDLHVSSMKTTKRVQHILEKRLKNVRGKPKELKKKGAKIRGMKSRGKRLKSEIRLVREGKKKVTDSIHFPVGVEHFHRLQFGKEQYSFIDRSLYLKDVLVSGVTNFLILRPRRTGKSLFLHMIESFAGIPEYIGEERSAQFGSLEIGVRVKELRARQETLSHKEKVELEDLNRTWSTRSAHPTIFLSFDTAKAPSTKTEAKSYVADIKTRISQVADSYRRIINLHKLPPMLAERLVEISTNKKECYWRTSLRDMCQILKAYYGKDTILLIDEYDSCLNFNIRGGMHAIVKIFLASLLTSALKDNAYLYKSVVMGGSRFIKNGLLSGLNNIDVSDVVNPGVFAPVFGFSDDEVQFLIKQKPECNVRLSEMREMYCGYVVGNAILYNPWSVMSCLHRNQLRPFWSSSACTNCILKKLRDDFDTLLEVAAFWKGEAKITIEVDQVDAVYDDDQIIFEDFFWVSLLQAGYVTVAESCDDNTQDIELKIPNGEMLRAFRNLLSGLAPSGKRSGCTKSVRAFVSSGNVDDLVLSVKKIILAASSKNLTLEQSYHNILFGMLYATLPDWIVSSEGESGHGFFDLCLIPTQKTQKMAVIIELKHQKNIDDEELELLAEKALKQINDKKYTNILQQYANVSTVLCLGLAFSKKKVKFSFQHENVQLSND
uniref:AAA-ATPase-like domain-containing protein n=1 Tax=Palpitomonas bilix TaxID=652834 RepID=A0A7S3LVA0_9EUKA|mmetsp:Transcript_4920/g.10460  ORF Transcript_4920/g.10460 Transcript_4920/m.10460 type:complete len:670 (+) Transcript_4920:73-2082(+)